MSCANPIDVGILGDYWAGALSQTEEDAVEEHLLGCDECSERFQQVSALADSVRKLVRQGSLLMVVSDTFLQRVAAEGLQVREYTPPRGGDIACTVKAEDDFLIGRLTADLSGVKQIDLSLCDEHGIERLRLSDIPFKAGAGSVAFQQSITYAKTAPSETMVARLIARDDAGGQHMVGEYTFRHTRTLPGPGAW